jgi:hypothetical protein
VERGQRHGRKLDQQQASGEDRILKGDPLPRLQGGEDLRGFYRIVSPLDLRALGSQMPDKELRLRGTLALDHTRAPGKHASWTDYAEEPDESRGQGASATRPDFHHSDRQRQPDIIPGMFSLGRPLTMSWGLRHTRSQNTLD